MGLTQQALADQLGIHKDLLELWERAGDEVVGGAIFAKILELAIGKIELDFAWEKERPLVDAALREVEEVLAGK
jgi:transcriptional regulator with XRE-family HTH domain